MEKETKIKKAKQKVTLKMVFRYLFSWACGLGREGGRGEGSHSRVTLGDPGAVSRAGRKGATKVFKHRRKSPWVPDHFLAVKRMLAPDWAQKMLCIIMPNRRTVYSEFVSSYTTAIFSLQLPCSFTGPTDCPWISEDAPE